MRTYAKVLSTRKGTKAYSKTIGEIGEIVVDGVSFITMRFEYITNPHSNRGLFYYKKNEIEIIDENSIMKSEEEEDMVVNGMEGFNKVAVCTLLEDLYSKEFSFALFDEEYDSLVDENGVLKTNNLVVVNARGKHNRQLAVVKRIMNVNEVDMVTTAQVVGIVDMNRYIKSEEEAKKKAENEKKKKEIQLSIKAKIDKIKDEEWYERMAKEYSSKDPELGELLSQLQSLQTEV